MTEIDFRAEDGGVRVVMAVEPMHDEVWTERLVQGRENELANLARVVSG